MIMRTMILLLLAALSLPALAADTGLLLHDTTLRSKPVGDAAAVMSLKKNAAVTILERNGGWYRVSAASGKTGWLRLFDLRYQSQVKRRPLGTELRTLSSFRQGRGAVATGVRGLSEEDNAKAGNKRGDITPVDKLGDSGADARRFAAQAGLKSHTVAYGGERR